MTARSNAVFSRVPRADNEKMKPDGRSGSFSAEMAVKFTFFDQPTHRQRARRAHNMRGAHVRRWEHIAALLQQRQQLDQIRLVHDRIGGGGTSQLLKIGGVGQLDLLREPLALVLQYHAQLTCLELRYEFVAVHEWHGDVWTE